MYDDMKRDISCRSIVAMHSNNIYDAYKIYSV